MKAARLLLLLGVLALAGYGVKFAWESEAMHLAKVEVTGNRRVAAPVLVQASGLRAGVHLLELSTDSVAQEVKRIPWVSTAKVERILPSKIRITVEERRATALVVAEGKAFLVSADGILLEEGEERLPRVVDLPLAGPTPGRSVEVAQFPHVLRIIEALPLELTERLVLIRAPSVDRITLELTEGVVVVFGAGEQIEDKVHAVKVLLDRYAAEGRSIASIDVRVPARPAVRPR